MTAKTRREILRAVAFVEPGVSGVDLSFAERQAIREQFALALAPVLGMDEETALVQLDSARMSS